jgi:iron complex outermembrane receptor protein
MKSNKMNVRMLLAAACAIANAPAMAQTVDPETDRIHGASHRHDDLEEVVVRATPMERDLIELTQSATVLTGPALQRELSNNLGDTLTRLPGLANASFGQNIGRPVIRGLQGQRVGILSNNMSSSDASAVSQDHAVSVEPFLADQIEVLRGPSTLLYGSGSIGGVVNVVTHSIPPEMPGNGLEGRAMAEVDSVADQRFAAGRIDFGVRSFAVHANAFYRRSDDYEIPGPAELFPEPEHAGDGGILEHSFLDNEGGTLGASWIGEQWRFGASWTAYDSNYGIPGASHHHEEEGEEPGEHEGEESDEHEGEESEFVTIDLESRRWEAEAVGTDPFSGFGQMKLKYARTDYTHTEFEGAEIGTVFDSETNDARLELRHDAWRLWEGAFGLQYTDVDFSAVGEEAFVPTSETETAAVFWVENAEFESWRLEFGLRYEDSTVTPEMAAGEDDRQRSFNPFSASLGAIWHLNEESHFSFTAARAERAPTAQELFAFGPHVASQIFEIGNAGLATESNMHLEAGYRIHGGRLTGTLIAYMDRFDDYIYQEATALEEDGLPVRIWTQQDADFVGGELELRYDLGQRPSGHWQLTAMADTVRAELDDNRRVPLMPPTRVGLGVEWDRRRWAGSLTWIHAGDHDRVAEFETPTPGYDLLNAEVSWLLPLGDRSEWQLFLKGVNLLDEDIRNSTSFLKDLAPQAGRNFVLGLRAAL